MKAQEAKQQLIIQRTFTKGSNAKVEAIDMAIKALDTIEKIKDIIREEEHYPVSNDSTEPHPNKADYDAVSADKFNRIWKVVSDAESH